HGRSLRARRPRRRHRRRTSRRVRQSICARGVDRSARPPPARRAADDPAALCPSALSPQPSALRPAMTPLLTFWSSHLGELTRLVGQHVMLVAVSTAIACAIAIPLGIFAARRPRLASPLTGIANVVQTVPSLAMFGFLLPMPLLGGVGPRAALVVLILYGLLPIVRTTIAGLRSIDASIVEAGTAMGMTPRELLTQVELPLALPSIVAGVRVAAVVGVGSATIAAAIGAGGLGEYIYRGLSMVDTTVILAGAIPAAALALVVDGLLLAFERRLSSRRRRRGPAVAIAATIII